MSVAFTLPGLFLIVLVLWDAFETMVFPRRVTRRARITRLFYKATWLPWKAFAHLFPPGRRREGILSIYGPLSLILLLGLWAFSLILGFGLLFWGNTAMEKGDQSFLTNMYLSGTTFFTLGLGDVKPETSLARFLTVAEAGIGFGFLALVIGYLPALNQSFSRREVSISLLDARAGSPPTAAEMLIRHNNEHGMESIRLLLNQWEKWSAELLESHLSYPVLAYFRSQHDNQSWLSALTAILDTGAFVMVGLEGARVRQAELTFAMARHAVVDLCLVFGIEPVIPEPDRLPPGDLMDLRNRLLAADLHPQTGDEADRKLAELRLMYEPFVYALSKYFCITLPPWLLQSSHSDNWQTSVWEPKIGALRVAGSSKRIEKHF